MIEWLKNLVHKHTPVWTTRVVIENVSIDMTAGDPYVDIQPGKKYLRTGYCLKCDKDIIQVYEIADIFDQEQPYDVT